LIDEARTQGKATAAEKAADKPSDAVDGSLINAAADDVGRAVATAGDAISQLLLPPSLRSFVWQSSGWHQLVLCVLSVVLFLVGTVPLEIQRRLVNDLVKGGDYHPVFMLTLIYVGLTLVEGGIKLVLNIYSSWVSETAVRKLRRRIARIGMIAAPSVIDGGASRPADGSDAGAACAPMARAEVEGIETSLLLTEVEPVGNFVGISIMQPLLQGGILVSVFGYLTYIDPSMAFLNLAVFAPQLLFVPLLQQAINRRAKRRISILRAVSGGVIGSNAAVSGGVIGSNAAVSAGAEGAQFGSEQDSRVDRVYRLNMGIYKLKFSMNFLMNLMYHLGVIGALAIGGWYVIHGQTELGTVIAFISGLAKVNDPWGDIVDWFREMTVTRVKYVLIRDAVGWIGHCHRQRVGNAAGPELPCGSI
jgi:ABC-type multidrug transport system fused ATPase/permease subunit